MKTGHTLTRVKQYADGRWGFDDYSSGKRIMVRRWSKEKAEKSAADIAVGLTNSHAELLPITAKEFAEFQAWKVSESTVRSQL